MAQDIAYIIAVTILIGIFVCGFIALQMTIFSTLGANIPLRRPLIDDDSDDGSEPDMESVSY